MVIILQHLGTRPQVEPVQEPTKDLNLILQSLPPLDPTWPVQEEAANLLSKSVVTDLKELDCTVQFVRLSPGAGSQRPISPRFPLFSEGWGGFAVNSTSLSSQRGTHYENDIKNLNNF
jgi:hypothetical protein